MNKYTCMYYDQTISVMSLYLLILEKRKWSEVEYAEYCCKNSECTNADARNDIQKYSGNGKKTLVATGNNAPSPGSNTRCRASGTISAPPVPAVLMVRGSGSVNSGAHCSTRWDSISRSGSSGCSSQHSCCGDDEDAYIVRQLIALLP